MKPISSLLKGLEILDCFNLIEEGVSAEILSSRLNIPLSTIYRYLETLEETGFLIKDHNKNYRLGFKVFQLGNIIALQINLIDIATPHMKNLASFSDETVLLTMISGWNAICIQTAETRRLVKLSLERGAILPLHAGGPSKILLAYQTDSFIDYFLKKINLTKFTNNTITNPILLRKELKNIRKEGYAYSYQEVDLGAASIATPILDSSGKIVASLSVAGPIERINNSKPQLTLLVKDIAKRISHDLTDKYKV